MELRRIVYGLFACLLIGELPSFGAPGEDNGEIAVRARRMAIDGKRQEALAILSRRLEEHASDVDARLVYGVVLSWEGRYEEARRALEHVLDQSPAYEDARSALINVEMWSDHPKRAEEVAREGQRRQPANVSFLLARAKALRKLNQPKEALDLVNNLLVLEPGNRQAKEIRQTLLEEAQRWETGIDQFYAWYNDGRGGWRENRVSFKRQTRIGSLAARLSRAHRFGATGHLIEIESYPRFRAGAYGFFSLGISPDSTLFPHYRVAGEVWQTLPFSMEGSLGFRRMKFAGNNVTLLTGSMARYFFGNWLLTYRPFVSMGGGDYSVSQQVWGRRYYSGIERFAGFRFGRGASPFEVRTVNDIEFLHAYTYMGEVNWRFQRRWAFNLLAGMSDQQRSGRPNLKQYFVDGAIYFKF
ncbi:MAG: YaiO family outer membrane beta-barrel protein [Acidobacteria bacterium]|nr:YaiO family outer membrane beta-barrel protein [Acidobacteriota bacterium]